MRLEPIRFQLCLLLCKLIRLINNCVHLNSPNEYSRTSKVIRLSVFMNKTIFYVNFHYEKNEKCIFKH